MDWNNPEERREYYRKYYETNKEKMAEQMRQWYETNKERMTEQLRQRYKTPRGRAISMVKNFRRNDEKYERGECTITPDWIMENIFTSKCIYCGESDWRKLGCDRIDNSLPHTPENVVCCCGACNNKRGTTPFDEFVKRCSDAGGI